MRTDGGSRLVLLNLRTRRLVSGAQRAPTVVGDALLWASWTPRDGGRFTRAVGRRVGGEDPGGRRSGLSRSRSKLGG